MLEHRPREVERRRRSSGRVGGWGLALALPWIVPAACAVDDRDVATASSPKPPNDESRGKPSDDSEDPSEDDSPSVPSGPTQGTESSDDVSESVFDAGPQDDITCTNGFADCNDDLELGMLGDGCESDTRSDVQHCGSCDPCPPAASGVGACRSGRCRTYALAVTRGDLSDTFGNDTGGSPFALLCGPGEVVVEIHGVGSDSVYGLGVRCGRLDLARRGDGYEVDVVATTLLDTVGGNVEPPGALFSRPCPAGTFVTRVSGTTWTPFGYPDGLLETISIACSRARFDEALRVVAESPVANLTVGVTSAGDTPFSYSCESSGGVNGFAGRSGALVDGISVSCASVAISVE